MGESQLSLVGERLLQRKEGGNGGGVMGRRERSYHLKVFFECWVYNLKKKKNHLLKNVFIFYFFACLYCVTSHFYRKEKIFGGESFQFDVFFSFFIFLPNQSQPRSSYYSIPVKNSRLLVILLARDTAISLNCPRTAW